MADLGKAYVQIIPSAKGIKGKITQALKGESSEAGINSGQTLGGKLVSTAKKIIVAAGIGKAIGASVTEGAHLEQSLGGVETIFKGSADKVVANARKAYATAGTSANDYMEGVVSFGASLMQATGNNADKAARIADMAFRDMSDNANKMGTNMRDIENAYQGFARGQYMMLDNLKLGYGGTKSEMERLLADAQELTGVEYDIDNLADVYEAIHAIQEEVGITGTTAEEAAETVSGSFNAMKAAAKNMLGSLAGVDELGLTVTEAMSNLADTVMTFLFGNLIPMIMKIFKSLPEAISAFFKTFAPQFIGHGVELISSLGKGILKAIPNVVNGFNELMTNLISFLQTQFPLFLQSGVEMINNLVTGFIESIPQLRTQAGDMINSLLEAFMIAAPQLLEAGGQIITNLVFGLVENAPAMLSATADVIGKLINTIITHLPTFIEKGKDFVINLLQGLTERAPELIEGLVTLIADLIVKIVENLPEFLAKGIEIVKNIWSGISEMKSELLNLMITIVVSLVTSIGEKLGEFLQKGSEVMDNIKTGLSNKKDAVISVIKTTVSEKLSAIQAKMGEFRTKGSELMNNLKSGLESKKSAVTTAVRGIITSARETIAGFRASFMTVGSNIIQGVADGIRNGASAVVSAAQNAARQALNAAKSFLGIRSPSRVFRDQIGGQMSAGMAIGIERNMGVVENAVSELKDLAKEDIENEYAYRLNTGINGISGKLATSTFMKEKQPVNLVMHLGNHAFQAFVKDITTEQDKNLEFKLAY